MQLTETAKLRLLIDGKEAISELTQLESRFKDANDAKKNFARGSDEWKALNNEAKDLKVSISALRERMDVTNMTFNEAKKYQRDLTNAMKGLGKQTDDYVAGAAKLKEVNTHLSSLNNDFRAVEQTVNRSQGMWDRVKESALGYLAAFNVQRVLDFLQQMVANLVTSVTGLDRMHLALKNVLATNDEYKQSISFLNTLSNEYGQSLVSLTKSYTGFIASSNSSNLSLEERQRIYGSIIKAGSALKLSNDQMEGSLLAVSQMFSKGNIQAEELRGQLGERLPGAFGIMAEALGVNEKQLNKMLEQGEVLAKDALPKFAKALENMYSDKAKSNLETYDGALNRMITKIVNWGVAQNENLGITKKVASSIIFVTDNFGLLIKLLGTAAAGFVAYTLAVNTSSVALGVKNGLLKLTSFLSGQATLARITMAGSTDAFTAAEIRAAEGARAFNSALLANPFAIVFTLLTALVGAYEIYSSQQEKLREQQAKLTNEISESVAPLRLQQAEFNRLSAAVLNGNLTLEERQKSLDTLKAKYPDNLKGINNLKDAELNLAAVIRSTNADFVTRAKLLENEVKINYNNELANKVLRERIQLENELKTASTQRTRLISGTAGYVTEFDSEAESIKKLIAAKDKLVQSTQKNNADLAKYSEDLTKKVVFNYNTEIAVSAASGGAKVKNDAKSNKEILADNKDFTAQMEKEALALSEKIKKIDESYSKWLLDEYQKRSKVIGEAVKDIQKNIKAEELADNKEHNAVLIDANKSLHDRVNAETKNMTGKRNEVVAAANKEAEEMARKFEQNLVNGMQILTEGLVILRDKLEKMIDDTTNANEKAALSSGKKLVDAFGANLDGASALMKGDIVGAAKGLFGYFKNLWDATIGYKNTLNELKKEAYLDYINERYESISKYGDQIAETFGEMGAVVKKMDDAGLSATESLIQNELKRAAEIKATYEKAVSLEGEYSAKVIANINKAYDLEVGRINAKYALLDQLANQTFSADVLKIKEAQSLELLGLITNEESKTAVINEYAAKRSDIIRITAQADQAITADTDAATVEAINKAIELRGKALTDLQNSYNAELATLANSEDQKRVVLKETERIKLESEDNIKLITLQNEADTIVRNQQKNIELAAAEVQKNMDLETEATRHNDELVRLAAVKDAAIAASFEALKSAVTQGYKEMQDAAQRAFDQGIITAQEYINILKQANELKNLIGVNTNSNGDFINNLKDKIKNLTGGAVPGFADGGIMPGDGYFENHGVLGGLSHNTPEGGNWVINARTGRIQAKVEAGEWMGIVNKNTTARYKDLLYSLANSSVSTTGKPVYAEKGYFGAADFGVSGSAGNSGALGGGNSYSISLNSLEVLMAELITSMNASVVLLESVAESSGVVAKKNLTISVNSILDAAETVNDINRRSSFF